MERLRRVVAALAVSALAGLVAGPAAGTAPYSPSGSPADCSAPVGVLCRYGIEYGNGPNQALEAYWSSTTSGGPAVLMIHGGGWSAGSSTDMYWESVYLVRN